MGSTLSVAATLVFVAVVGSLLTAKGQMSLQTDPWHTAPIALHLLHGDSRELSPQSETLEHSLESPTPLHSFKALPLALNCQAEL